MAPIRLKTSRRPSATPIAIGSIPPPSGRIRMVGLVAQQNRARSRRTGSATGDTLP